MKNPSKKALYTYLTLTALLVVGLILSILLGSARMSATEFLDGLFLKNGLSNESIIIYNLRLPRALGAVVAGMGLAVSGAILQTVTNNGLAGPNIIGVNAGAGCAVVLIGALLPLNFYLQPLAAFIGAFLTTLLIVLVAGKINGNKATIILAGIAITALFNAAISLVLLIDDDLSLSYRYFSVGGLNGVTLEKLIIPFIIIALSVAISLGFAEKIDALSLGDVTAISLGVNAKKIRLVALILASLSAAAAVSFAGLLGFVGLAVPHIAKRLVSIKLKNLVPLSALLGGVLLLYADLLSRIILPKTEVPLGIITAFLGAPFFFILAFRGNKNA